MNLSFVIILLLWNSTFQTESENNLLVCCLTREGTVRIPRGQDSIQIGDNVIIVTTHKGRYRDILALRRDVYR